MAAKATAQNERAWRSTRPGCRASTVTAGARSCARTEEIAATREEELRRTVTTPASRP